MEQFLIFVSGDQGFALDIKKISKIIEYEKPQQIPESSPFVLGVIQHSGTVLPIISLTKRLYGTEELKKDHKKVIIILWKNREIGFVVDDIEGIWTVDDTEVVTTDQQLQIAKEYVVGHIKKEDRLTTIINADKLFSTKQEMELLELEHAENEHSLSFR